MVVFSRLLWRSVYTFRARSISTTPADPDPDDKGAYDVPPLRMTCDQHGNDPRRADSGRALNGSDLGGENTGTHGIT
jgi:hypothetical protein